MKSTSQIGIVLGLLLLLVVGWLVYAPGMKGPFLFDDFDNLKSLNVGVDDLASLEQYLRDGQAGPTGRPISKLSFLLDDNAWPTEPAHFKKTNILIHLVSGLLLFWLLSILFAVSASRQTAYLASLFFTAFFLLHPIQVSTVLYVVQRMTQLSTLFVLLGLLSYSLLRLRNNGSPLVGMIGMVAALGCFGLLALFSKENGVLLPVYVAALEFTVFSKLPAPRVFVWFRRLVIYLPSLAIAVYLMYLPRWLRGYEHRDFGLAERLLTEPVVIMDYLYHIVTMKVAGLGFFHDDYVIYDSLLNGKVLGALIFISVSMTAAIRLRSKAPLFSLGVLWFFGGHLLESTTIALELYFEHRNYLPMVGALLAFYYLLMSVAQKVGGILIIVSRWFALGVLSISTMSTYGYVQEWSSLERLIPVWASEHPDSPRSYRVLGHMFATIGMPLAAQFTLEDGLKRFPKDLSYIILSIDISCAYGKPLRFDLAETVEHLGDFEITDGLRPAMLSLKERLADGRCEELSESFHFLAENADVIEGASNRLSILLSLRAISGDLYMRDGEYVSALRNYAYIDQKRPSPDSALRLSNMYIQLGDFSMAIEFLSEAKLRDMKGKYGLSEARKALYDDKLRTLQSIRKDLEALKKS